MNRIYHLSYDSNLTHLTPNIPCNRMEIELSRNRKIIEEEVTKRICFSNSISNCLTALAPIPITEWYVYTPDEEVDVYYPTPQQVPDCMMTNEVWVTKECKVKCIGKIKADISTEIEKRRNSEYGYRLIITTYDWEWIENYNNHNINNKKLGDYYR